MCLTRRVCLFLLLTLSATGSGCRGEKLLSQLLAQTESRSTPSIQIHAVSNVEAAGPTRFEGLDGPLDNAFDGQSDEPGNPVLYQSVLGKITELDSKLRWMANDGSPSPPTTSKADASPAAITPLSKRQLAELDAAVSALERRYDELLGEIKTLKQNQIAERQLVDERFNELKGMIQSLEQRLQSTEAIAQPPSGVVPTPALSTPPPGYVLMEVTFPCGTKQNWWVPPGRSVVTCPQCLATSELNR